MLTIKDIVELGFTYNEDRDWFSKGTITIAASNIIHKHSDYIQIWLGEETKATNLLLFQGWVKNKEELEVLLEQVYARGV